MAKYKHNINGVEVDFTAEEEAAKDAEIKAWNDGKLARKQSEMRTLRNQYLTKTDYLALSDVTMSDAQKTWRQSLRDLPANEDTLDKVENVLARDSEGNLTNSIWTIPS
jgi:hypothetical protein